MWLFSRESKHQNSALLFESARVLAIVLSAVDIKKFVSHTSAILKTNYTSLRDCDLWIAVKNKFFTPTCTKSFHHTAVWWKGITSPLLRLRVRDVSDVRKLFWKSFLMIAELNSAMNKKFSSKRKSFCWTETFYEKVLFSQKKISAE